jgi:hypothetical protein
VNQYGPVKDTESDDVVMTGDMKYGRTYDLHAFPK